MSGHVHAVLHMPQSGTGWAAALHTLRVEAGRPSGSWHTCKLCTAPWGLGLLLALLLAAPLSAQTLTGPARAIDGDTLELQGQRVRLHGVDAPEIRQTCTRPCLECDLAMGVTPGLSSETYACGVAARRRLEELIDSRPVTCRALDKDRYGRAVARCFVDAPHIDLSGWLVRNGLAVAYTKYSRDYVPQETAARGEQRGSGHDHRNVWRAARRPRSLPHFYGRGWHAGARALGTAAKAFGPDHLTVGTLIMRIGEWQIFGAVICDDPLEVKP
jgi:endonuclease YncB( thermonuclease family)